MNTEEVQPDGGRLIFSELACGETIQDEDYLLLELTSRDAYGNWSLALPGVLALVDRTPPDLISVTIQPQFFRAGSLELPLAEYYLTDKTTLSGIDLSAVDRKAGFPAFPGVLFLRMRNQRGKRGGFLWMCLRRSIQARFEFFR